MELVRRVEQLAARLNQTSRNSSKPPSSDPPSAKPRAAKVPSGRPSGGQPGHEGPGRKLKPASEVDQVIDVRPEQWRQCGTLLLGDDAEPERHQGTDFPRITPVVTEYRRHGLWCVAGGVSTQAAWPATMPAGSFGPRVHATVGYWTGRSGASQREVQEILATLCQTEVSVGSSAALEHAVSTALAWLVYASAATTLPSAESLYAQAQFWKRHYHPDDDKHLAEYILAYDDYVFTPQRRK